MRKTQLGILLLATLLTGHCLAQPPSEIGLFKVWVSGRGDVEIIASEGIDIWEVHPGHLIAALTKSDEARLAGLGFLSEQVSFPEAEPVLPAGVLTTSVTYRNLAEANADLLALESSGLAAVYDIGDTVEGRDILAVKISDNVLTDEDEPEIFFCGCHHAREWISVEVPLRLAEYLVSEYATDPDVKQLVDGGEIWICPIVNPDGYLYSWEDYRYWRKNRRDNLDGSYGVDPNRNYGYMWGGEGSSSQTYSDTYRGPSAFSEPETQAVRDFISSHDFRGVMSYHSYSQLILYPWGYTYDDTQHAGLFGTMAEEISSLIYGVHGFTYTAQQASDLYLVSGATMDWVYGALGVPSFATELRPNSGSGGGFVLPADQIVPTFEENLPAALFLIEWTQNAVDQDLDQLPDAWEYFELGGIGFSGEDDSDVPTPDGRTNIEEFEAGTDPLDPSSFFAVTAVDAAADVQITWRSVEDKTYAVYYSDDPFGSEMTWTMAESGVPADAGDVTSWTDDGASTGTHPLDPSVAHRHYRVSVGE